MRAAATTSVLLPLLLSACATATDAARNGQPVVETTIASINDDPDAWEGKWVRLEGWLEAASSLLLASPVWSTERAGIAVESIRLDPQERRRQAAHWNHKRVVVSGKVDLTCWDFWRSAPRSSETVILHVRAIGEFEYCNQSSSPYLVDVLVAPQQGTSQ